MNLAKFLSIFLVTLTFVRGLKAEDEINLSGVQFDVNNSSTEFSNNQIGLNLSPADSNWRMPIDNSFAPSYGINLGRAVSGQSFLSRVADNAVAAANRTRDYQFRMRMGNASVGNSNQSEAGISPNLRAYCAHLIAGKSLNEKPEGCSYDGTTVLDGCDLGTVITETENRRIVRMVSTLTGDKQQQCEENLKTIIAGRLTIAGHLAQASIQAATSLSNVAHTFETISNVALCSRGEGTSPAGTGPIEGCNDFNDTPLAGNEMTNLMSKFITHFDGFGGIGKYFLLRGTTAECKSCFGDKYKINQEAEGLPANDYNEQYNKKLAEAKIELRVRKAEQALSEFIKYQERNMFMSRFLSAQSETCSNIPSFSKLERGCDPEQARQVLEKIAKRHGVRASPNDLPLFVNELRSSHMSKLEQIVPVPDCEGRGVTHGGYLSAFQTQISSTPMQPSFLFNTKTKDDLKNCGEYDQRCMIEVLVKSLTEKNGGNEVSARNDISTFFRQPFYRTLLTNRQSLLDYADSGDVTIENNLAKYKEANKDRFAEIARRDSEVACKGFGKDFMRALCVKDVELGKTYSGQGLKEELADMLANSSNPPVAGDAGKNLVNLSVACNMLNMSGKLNTELHESETVSDLSFDRNDLADSFLRAKISEPSRFSPKKTAFIENYAKKICQDALQERDRAERAAFHASVSRPASMSAGTNSSNSDFSCFSLSLERYLPDCFTNVFNGITTNLSQVAAYSPVPYNPGSSLGLFTDRISRLGQADWLTGPTSDYNFLGDDDSSRLDGGFRTTSALSPLGFPSNPTQAGAVAYKDEPIEGSATQGGFLQSATQMAAQLNASASPGVPHIPTWTMPIPETSVAARGPSSVNDDDEGTPSERRRGTSERILQEVEARQTQAEQQVLAQAREAQTIQDLKNQTQIEQLRIELQKLQLSNRQLMTNIQKLSAPRKTQSEENIFDQPFTDDAQEVVESSTPVSNRASARIAASSAGQVKTDVPSSVARASIDGAAIATAATRLPDQDKGDKPVTTTATATAATVGVARGGTQATSTRGSSSGGSVSFVPSLSLQRTIASESTQEVIPQEKKIELLKEFLSYVEKNPEYREGRYLSSENDRITIEYEGRTVVLNVTDIQDTKARVHLQERLLRQRMVINQYVRATRLENLKRLLASTRAQP